MVLPGDKQLLIKSPAHNTLKSRAVLESEKTEAKFCTKSAALNK